MIGSLNCGRAKASPGSHSIMMGDRKALTDGLLRGLNWVNRQLSQAV